MGKIKVLNREKYRARYKRFLELEEEIRKMEQELGENGIKKEKAKEGIYIKG